MKNVLDPASISMPEEGLNFWVLPRKGADNEISIPKDTVLRPAFLRRSKSLKPVPDTFTAEIVLKLISLTPIW